MFLTVSAMKSDTLFFDKKEVCNMFCVKLFFSWFIGSQYSFENITHVTCSQNNENENVYENLFDGVCQFFFRDERET